MKVRAEMDSEESPVFTSPDNRGLSGSLVHLQISSLCKRGRRRQDPQPEKASAEFSDMKSWSTLSEGRLCFFPSGNFLCRARSHLMRFLGHQRLKMTYQLPAMSYTEPSMSKRVDTDHCVKALEAAKTLDTMSGSSKSKSQIHLDRS